MYTDKITPAFKNRIRQSIVDAIEGWSADMPPQQRVEFMRSCLEELNSIIRLNLGTMLPEGVRPFEPHQIEFLIGEICRWRFFGVPKERMYADFASVMKAQGFPEMLARAILLEPPAMTVYGIREEQELEDAAACGSLSL